jgi:hypothetical protein
LQDARAVPNATRIHEGLTTIANEAGPLAIAWHAALVVAGVALFAGWRPSRSTAAALLAVPLVLVGIVAWAFDNPFNGTVFLVLASALLASESPPDGAAVRLGAPWMVGVGILMAMFGWSYPHFLDVGSLRYLYAAPTGLVPCPTLAIVIGLALIGDGIGTPRWGVLLGAAGIFYSLFGAFRLGVEIDLLLLVGASCLARPAVPLWRGPGVQSGPGGTHEHDRLAFGLDEYSRRRLPR